MVWALVSLGAALVTAIFLSVYLKNVRETVAGWLRVRGLDKSWLMDAWVILERAATSVRSRVLIKSRSAQVIEIKETTCALHEIDDPEIRAALLAHPSYQRNIMSILN